MKLVLCTLVLNEMEWLPLLYLQHKNWPDMLRWIFVESADRAFADVNPELVSDEGLSIDGTTQYLSQLCVKDSRVTHIKHGFSEHPNYAQGKCQARTRYLIEADKYQPDYIFVLDADEFYAELDQAKILDRMTSSSKRYTGFSFRFRHPWRPPSIRYLSAFQYEVIGGFWNIPHSRGWKWFPELRYSSNHNTPETRDGYMLDYNLKRFREETGVGHPECIHMAFASSARSRHAKNLYYANRGEGKSDHRGWFVKSREAFETWRPGEPLPREARVVPFDGVIPECFYA